MSESGERDHEWALLIDAARVELEMLWDDLDRAGRGRWTGQCEQLADRIQTLSLLVGATHWEHIQIGLIRSGIYERVYREAGIAYMPVDHAAVEAFYDRLVASGRRLPDPT